MACRLCLWCSVQDAVCKPLRVAAEKSFKHVAKYEETISF